MSQTRHDALAPIGKLMEQRRRDLGMTWREVATAGALSIETLRTIRYGESVPHGLTRASIERALRWAPGSVDRFLESGTAPVSADAAPAAGEDAERQAVIDGVRALYPGDRVAESIMTQWHKSLEQRQRELDAVRRATAAGAAEA